MAKKKILLLVMGGLFVLGLAVLYLSLPGLVSRALASQAEKIGLKSLRLRVLHVGWGRLDLGDLAVGDRADPALTIRRVSVAYSPVGLLGRKIRSIRLSGVMVRVESSGRGFRFPGWEGRKQSAAGSGKPFTLKRLELKDGRLSLRLGGREFAVPFSARGEAWGPGYVLQAQLRQLAVPITLLGILDKEFEAGRIEFSAPDIDLGILAAQGLLGSSIVASGSIGVHGDFNLTAGRFGGAAIRGGSSGEIGLNVPGQGAITMDLRAMTFRLGPEFDLRDIHADARISRLGLGVLAVHSPFIVVVQGRRWPEFEYSVLGLRLDRPLPLYAERISGKVAGPWEAVKFSGDFQIQDRAGLPAALEWPWAIAEPYALAGSFRGGRSGGKIAWSLKARGDGGLVLASGKDSVRGTLKLNASLEGDARQGRATVSGRLAAADLRVAGARVQAGEFAGSAGLQYDVGGRWRARGSLQVQGGRFLAPGDNGWQASGISISLPWSYPGAGPGKSGSFSIKRLQGGSLSGQDISGILGQEGQGLVFSGLAHSGLPEIAMSFKGNVASLAAGRLQADFLVPPAVLPAGTKLQALLPLLRGMEAGGRFGAQGRIWAASGRLGGRAGLEISDGDLDHAGEGIALRGVQTAVRLENLFAWVTPPGQRIRFRELRWQGNVLRNGEAAFKGEGGGRLFIESAHCEWNRGTITLDPLRLDPGGTSPQVTLRCQDVDLAEMLNALAGSQIVSGDARLSGVIPLRVINGSPVFLDGHLDTEPGRGGRLQVSKPEAISGGQALVEEAIRDFNYNWIKVRLSGGNDRLNMVVSIEGAPARKLPLRYDQKAKDFIRDSTGKRHVELKGLLLDIRFIDIDLKDLLEAGGQVTAGQQ